MSAAVAGSNFGASRPPATILLVDDDMLLRSLLHSVLRRGGYHVLDGGDAPEALRIAQQQDKPIQLLITDIEMPGMNGLELTRRLRKERPELKVIFMSGSHKAAADASEPFISKPFTVLQLLNTVENVLNP